MSWLLEGSRVRFTFAILVVGFALPLHARGEGLSIDQRLIVACYQLDVDAVAASIRDGADVNARFGKGDPRTFADPWAIGSRGWLGDNRWTPLIALAQSSDLPDPPRELKNTHEDRDWADTAREAVPEAEKERRRDRALAILCILLSHKPELNSDDGYGATALYKAIDTEKTEMAKVLIRFGANVSTKTGVYIDGAGDLTPLHQAFNSVELTKLLLEHGADPTAKNSEGETPLDWAKQMGDDPAVVHVYESRK